jgi:alpha-tubulin suppressor-like RCC1 family protein
LYEGVKKAVIDDSNASGLGGVLFLTTDNRVISYEPAEPHFDAYIFRELSDFRDASDISSGAQQAYLLDKRGNVYGRGANGRSSLGVGGEEWWVNEPAPVASGVDKILDGSMLIKNGSLMMWGTVAKTVGIRGETEYGGTVADFDFIVYGKTPVLLLNGVVTADGRKSHFVALDRDGGVYAWGQNSYGQLGNGGSENQTSPVIIVTFH